MQDLLANQLLGKPAAPTEYAYCSDQCELQQARLKRMQKELRAFSTTEPLPPLRPSPESLQNNQILQCKSLDQACARVYFCFHRRNLERLSISTTRRRMTYHLFVQLGKRCRQAHVQSFFPS